MCVFVLVLCGADGVDGVATTSRVIAILNASKLSDMAHTPRMPNV